jgi:Spy/CpxP family protein refolding chaperone
MTPLNNHRILVWIIVILIATNLSTVGSFYYHKLTEVKVPVSHQEVQADITVDHNINFFSDQLNLEADQTDQFRTINQFYNQTARAIELNLSHLRRDLIEELGVQNPDTLRINQLTSEIGENHRKLKQLTATFYLNMKKICSKDQQIKLHSMFQSMQSKQGQETLQKGRYQWGKRRKNQSLNE